jgi:hypothetical protein
LKNLSVRGAMCFSNAASNASSSGYRLTTISA